MSYEPPPFPNNEPPPNLYMSNAKNGGQIWLFTDVRPFVESYSSNPNIQPLHGLNSPYVSEGSGSGWTYSFTARINPIYSFFVSSIPQSAARVSNFDKGAWDDYLSLQTLIKEYGPSPQMLLHMPKKPVTKCILTSLSAEPAVGQSNVINGKEVMVWLIPVAITLQQYEDSYVRVA